MVTQATGIMEMRQALEEKEDAKSLKQKTRERVRPKMGKLTIDYQKLHDAFFRSELSQRPYYMYMYMYLKYYMYIHVHAVTTYIHVHVAVIHTVLTSDFYVLAGGRPSRR